MIEKELTSFLKVNALRSGGVEETSLTLTGRIKLLIFHLCLSLRYHTFAFEAESTLSSGSGQSGRTRGVSGIWDFMFFERINTDAQLLTHAASLVHKTFQS